MLAQQAEQEMLGADIVMVEIARLFDRVLDHLLGARSLWKLAHRDHFRATLDELLHLEADLAEVDVEVFQHIGADTRPFLNEAEQDVLSADVLVIQPLGLLVCQGHHLACTVGQSLEHGNSLILTGYFRLLVHASWRGPLSQSSIAVF